MPQQQERTLQRSIYSGVRLAQRIRHWVAADKKPVFDVEADPELWDKSLKVKAKAVGISVERYQVILTGFYRRPLFRLAITIMRCENDFLDNWWKNITLAEQWAKDKQDYKGLLMVEREKQMGIKRLVETGRMIAPEEYQVYKKKPKPKPSKPIVDEHGVVDIEKIP